MRFTNGNYNNTIPTYLLHKCVLSELYKEMIYLLIILALLSAYREVQILIDRGSWRKEDYRNIFWKTDWQSKWKNLDSFHVSNGLFILLMLYAMSIDSIIWYLVPVYWFGFFYVRNIGLHIIFKKKPIYSYLWKIWS